MLIVTFDGGGVLGYFSSEVYKRLTKKFPDLTNQVDLLGGTSTGALIALSLASGRTPAEISQLYLHRSKEIFYKPRSWHRRIWKSKFQRENLDRVLREQFGNLTMGDLGKQVIVPTFEIDGVVKRTQQRAWQPTFFHNIDPTGDKGRPGTLVRDVAAHTSAAPTYFPTSGAFVDGGLIANHPGMSAVTAAMDSRLLDVPLEDIYLLSIGTGRNPKRIDVPIKNMRRQALDWGLAKWAMPLVDIFMTGSMDTVDYYCRRLLGPRYLRINPKFSREISMDDVEDKTMSELRNAAWSFDMSDEFEWLKAVLAIDQVTDT